LIDGTEGADTVFFGGLVGTGEVGVDDGGETDRVALLLEMVINARVVASEGAYAYDGYVDAGVGWQKRI
jgi:hypothetical protein